VAVPLAARRKSRLRYLDIYLLLFYFAMPGISPTALSKSSPASFDDRPPWNGFGHSEAASITNQNLNQSGDHFHMAKSRFYPATLRNRIMSLRVNRLNAEGPWIH